MRVEKENAVIASRKLVIRLTDVNHYISNDICRKVNKSKLCILDLK